MMKPLGSAMILFGVAFAAILGGAANRGHGQLRILGGGYCEWELNEMAMYCPHCGRPFRDIGGVLTCVEGKMPLGQVLQVELLRRCPIQSERPSETEVGRKIGRWFCPGCGIPFRPFTSLTSGPSP